MPSTLGILSRILEVETENIELNIPHDRKFGDRYREPSFYGSGLPFSSWNHSTKFGDNLNDGLKTEMDCNDETQIFDIQIQGGGPRNRPNTMDKFLHLQDAVPCKLRAKHGCATHPRSIAERVRRTRISERMRKLQVLVPNMEKFCRRGNSDYLIGIGSYNITGPTADVNMMEYANMEQVASGLHVRLQARTFIVAEPQGNHVVFVNLDACMASQIVTIKVLEKLKKVVDVILWRNKNLTAGIIGVTMTAWLVFERCGYTLISLVSSVFLLLFTILYLWAKLATILNR